MNKTEYQELIQIQKDSDYLKKSYNALADTINENKTFFKQYTSDLDDIPPLVTP